MKKGEFIVERSIRLHPHDVAELEVFAKSLNLPQVVLIRWAIREWLDRQNERPSIVHNVELINNTANAA